MKEKCSFDDWFSGEVNLDTEPLFNDGNGTPTIVSLNNFSPLDQEKILEEKRIIFYNKVKNIFEGFKNEFFSRFDNSDYKLRLLNSHIKESFAILNSKIPNMDIIKTKYWEILFAKEDLIKIQYYYKIYLLKGITNNFHFVHSVNSKYDNENFVKNEVYSTAMNEFYIFLVKLKNRIEKQRNNSGSKSHQEDSEINLEKQEENDIIKIYPHIFKNIDSISFFLEYVSKAKKNKASFADFYAEFSPINGFKPNLSKKQYCDFINSYYEKYEFDLNENDIKSKSRSIKNKTLFENINQNFKEKKIHFRFNEE